MRLKRLMSIVLAVALVMSFAMSASAATTLYLEEDFDYADLTAFTNAVNVDSTAFATKDTVSNWPLLSADTLSAARTAEKGMVTNSTGWIANSSYAQISTNSNGYKQLEHLKANGNNWYIAFVPALSWNAATSNTQSYVISFEMAASALNTARYYNGFNIYGMRNGTTPGVANIASMYENAAVNTNVSNMYGNPAKNLSADAARFTYVLKYNGDGGLTRDGYYNGASWYSGGTYRHEDMTTVEGFGYHPASNLLPSIANVKIYTIGNTDTFDVASTIDGTKVTNLDSQTVTLTFSQPIYEPSFTSSAITMTGNNNAVSGLIVGEPENAVVNGAYVTTVDVTLPALADSTDYVISVSGVKNELGTSLTKSSVSFSTPKPEITTTVPTITGNTVGSMSEASVAVSNNTESTNKNVAVIYAVYASGKLVDVVYANDTVAANTTATISAGVKLPAGATKAKVMVWDGLNTINPYRGFVSVDVAQ